MSKEISKVFHYGTTIGPTHGAFIDRPDLRQELQKKIFKQEILLLTGYSGIGKTSLLEQVINSPAVHKKYPQRDKLITLERIPDPDKLLQTIGDAIAPHISGNLLGQPTPDRIARAVHENRLLLIIDGLNAFIDDHPQASKELHNICKEWTRFSNAQGKIILVAPGLPAKGEEWFENADKTARMYFDDFSIPPWKPEELERIVSNGAASLGVSFSPELLHWITNISGGLPLTMHLLASLTAIHANNGNETFPENSGLEINLHNLSGISGQTKKFKRALYPKDFDKIQSLSTPALFALYLLGINNSSLSEKRVFHLVEKYGFSLPNDLPNELDALLMRNNKEEIPYWTIIELSNATHAFYRLYTQSKRRGGKDIKTALDRIHEGDFQNQSTNKSPLPPPKKSNNKENTKSPPVSTDDRHQVFISYSHEDKKWLNELQIMLKTGVRSGDINVWDDTKIKPGKKWETEIDKALSSAKVAILLVSANFLASDFIAKDELPPLLQAAEEEDLTILWIYVSACPYEDTEIAKFQAAHDIKRPLDQLSKAQRQKMLTKIYREVKKALS